MKTEILVITDRSGSMAPIAPDVIGGYNQFLKEQREVPGEARVTFTQFDHEYAIVYQAKVLADAPNLDAGTYMPRGSTALNDAMGRTLNEQGARIASEKWADLVVVCVITDGGENASREYTGPKVAEMVKHAEANGWKFVYLAAGQAAMATAANLGIAAQGFAASAAGTAGAYAATSSTLRSLRTAKP